MDLRSLSLQRLTDVPWVAFDTEATGYSNISDRLIEVAGVRFHREPGRWVVDGEYSELTNPGQPIPQVTTNVHGLTDTDVATAPLPLEVLERFFKFADGAVLMAHYAPFDVGAMAFAHVRQGRGVPEFFILDTFTLSKLGVPGLPKYIGSSCLPQPPKQRQRRARAAPGTGARTRMLLYPYPRVANPLPVPGAGGMGMRSLTSRGFEKAWEEPENPRTGVR